MCGLFGRTDASSGILRGRPRLRFVVRFGDSSTTMLVEFAESPDYVGGLVNVQSGSEPSSSSSSSPPSSSTAVSSSESFSSVSRVR